MKILVFPHHLEIGGSQTNALDIATAVRERTSHDLVFFATPGPGSALLAERGFELLEAPAGSRSHPSPRIASALAALVSRRRVDVVHAWDWPQCLDAYFGVHLPCRTPVLGSIMSMAVLSFLPRTMPLTYGTPELVEQARALGWTSVSLLEPPVDTRRDAPCVVDGRAWRSLHGVADEEVAVVCVSRLVSWLKLEGLHRTVDAVAALTSLPVRLLVVGEGPASGELAGHAYDVNREAGREVVTLVGAELDPRAAYAAADVVVGMGGSVLRGMAFAKPAVVLGEAGFSQVFDPDTAPGFVYRGLYGIGTGVLPRDPLVEQLGRLVSDAVQRRELAAFSRRLVVDRYDLTVSADAVVRRYEEVVGSSPEFRRLLVEASRTLAWRAGGAVRNGLASRRAALRATPSPVPAAAAVRSGPRPAGPALGEDLIPRPATDSEAGAA